MSEVTRILDRVQQGDPNAAEELLPLVYDELRRLAARQKVSGPEHASVAGTFDKMAWVPWEQDKRLEAESAFRKALPIYRRLLNNRDTNAVVALNQFAWAVLAKQDKPAEAENLLNELLTPVQQVCGTGDPMVAERMNNMGDWHRDRASTARCQQGIATKPERRSQRPARRDGTPVEVLHRLGGRVPGNRQNECGLGMEEKTDRVRRVIAATKARSAMLGAGIVLDRDTSNN